MAHVSYWCVVGTRVVCTNVHSTGRRWRDWIVKIALGPTDFPEDMLNLVKISRAVMDEQWQVLSRKPSPYLLAPTANFISEDGRYCLLYPRHDVGFKQLMGQSRSLPELLRILARCAQALNHLPSDLCPHGNIHPNNVFWDGQHVLFMDPLTPLLRLHHADLLKAKGLHHSPRQSIVTLEPKRS